METKHTPGPWTFKTDNRTGDNGIVAPSTGVFIEAFADIRHSNENARNEAMANARLIVAAPKMLQTLIELLSQLDQGGSSGKIFARDAIITQAREVVAKATGAA